MATSTTTIFDPRRLSPALVRHLFGGQRPEGVTEARLTLRLLDDREGGAELVIAYDDPNRPPTVHALRAPGVSLFGAMFLRDHPDEFADLASEMVAYSVEHWLGQLAEDRGRRYDLLALWVMADEAERDELAQDERNAATLERELEKHIRGLAARIAAVPREARKLDGSARLWLDEALAGYLDELGTAEAAKASKAVRRKADKRLQDYRAGGSAVEWLEPWLSDRPDGDAAFTIAGAPPALRGLAKVVWRDEVKPKLLEAQRKPAALVMVVSESVAHLLSRPRRELERDGQLALRLPGEVLVRVGAIDSSTLDALMVDRGIKLFGSLASHRVLRWLVFTAHKQALERNPDPRTIRIDGGWSTFANDVLGMRGKKAAEQVRDIIEAMHATELPLPPHGNYTRLLIREAHTPRGRGGQQWIKLLVGWALLPDYVHELQAKMGNTAEARRAARLVPLLEVPPLVGGRQNEHGAQAAFSMLLVAYMRDHARELVEYGGVSLPDPALADMARRAGLPLALVGPVLDRWTQDGADGPALLRRVGPDRYTLGDAHADARKFLEAGGRAEINGAAAGRRSGEKRRAKVQRLAGKGRAK